MSLNGNRRDGAAVLQRTTKSEVSRPAPGDQPAGGTQPEYARQTDDPPMGFAQREGGTPAKVASRCGGRATHLDVPKNETVILVIYGCFWLFFTQIFVTTHWITSICVNICKNHQSEPLLDQSTLWSLPSLVKSPPARAGLSPHSI